MAHSYEDCPDHLKPQQMIFLSADIVGSTALKQTFRDFSRGRTVSDGQTWFAVIQGFYIKAVQSFFGRWNDICKPPKKSAAVCGEAPLLWKTIGDEIVFRKTISDHRQVALTIRCWVAAMQEIRKFLKAQDPKLDLKCTAWIAEFPVQNKIVIGPTGEIADQLDPTKLETVGRILSEHFGNPGRTVFRLDFIGPAIDVGFRLAGLSTSRKFVISIDVAYLLALDSPHPDSPRVYYDGMAYLKGVLGGLEYPVFWIDMSAAKSIDRAEDMLLAREACDRDDTAAFCRRFYSERSNYATAPFIVGDHDHALSKQPAWYAEAHQRIVEQYS